MVTSNNIYSSATGVLKEIFKDQIDYYGGQYDVIVSDTPIAQQSFLAMSITAYNKKQNKLLPELYINVKDIINEKENALSRLAKRLKLQISEDYAGKTLVRDDVIQSAFPERFNYGIVIWTHGKNDDVVHTFNNEDDMMDNIKVMKKLNKDFRFRCFKGEEEFEEYFPDIYE